MTDAQIDVVIPVWNRPYDTRNCLVNLINNTPAARFIMFDSGSDRETEKLLQEFADGLDDRALLMRDDNNIGFVRGANRGFLRSEAPYLALVRNTSQVSSGWLQPLLDFASGHPDAGILIPSLVPGAVERRGALEVSSASFAAMVITRRLFEEVGGFDEGLDGGLWCLRDFARRACAKGFLTYHVPGPPVSFQEETLLGSEHRRQETLLRSIALFKERWGESASYVMHVPKGVEPELLRLKFDWLLKGARHGDSFHVLLPAPLYKPALQAGLALLHENIKIEALPRLAGENGRRRLFERIVACSPDAQPVAAIDGIPFPWSDSYLTFTELSERIRLGYL